MQVIQTQQHDLGEQQHLCIEERHIKNGQVLKDQQQALGHQQQARAECAQNSRTKAFSVTYRIVNCWQSTT